MKKLSNISIKEFRKALKALGLSYDRTKGGHEAWSKAGLKRPIIFQNHVEPIKEFIIKNALRDLGLSKEEFLKTLEDI